MDGTGRTKLQALTRRAAWALLGASVAVVLFSLAGSAALNTGRPVPEWDYARLSSAMAVLNVLAGFMTAFLHMGCTQGARALLCLLGLCVLVAGGAELVGTLTGIPFGAYHYTAKLGPRLMGEVPYVIPLAWFMVAYASLTVAGALAMPKWGAAVFAAAMVVIWDVALDPAMTAEFPAWVWTEGGVFYGIPLGNYVAWFGVALTIALVHVYLTKPAREVPTRLPWALYTIQSVFPAALAAIYGRGWATAAWAIGFAAIVAVWVVLRRTLPAPTSQGTVGQ